MQQEEKRTARPRFVEVFALNMKEARLARGLTQRDLAALTGLSVGSISEIERGQQNITAETIQKIADALVLPYGKLVSSKDDIPFNWEKSMIAERTIEAIREIISDWERS